MKNPNGYGSVIKLYGNRRKPFAIRITTEWVPDEKTGKSKQKYRNVGYYKTQSEAMIALAEFNQNPFTVESSIVTFKEIFKKWSDERYPKFTKSNINSYNAAFKISESLHNIKFGDLRKAHMQNIINACNKSHSTKQKVKTLYNQLFKYALENDIISKDYSDFVSVGNNEKESIRIPFTNDEIKKIWDNIDNMNYADTILIQIYTGFRIGELLKIENINIDLKNNTIKGGSKTAAGKNRIVPICEKILPLVKKRYNPDNKFFITSSKNKELTYISYYAEKWKKIMMFLDMDHKPHDCRHTFATMMDNAGANKLSIKRIMGHTSKDITDKVYTHKDIEELHKAVSLLND